jgi:hypothetical protein
MTKIYTTLLVLFFAFNLKAQTTQTITINLDASTPTFNRPEAGNPPSTLSGIQIPYNTFVFTAPVSGLYTFAGSAPEFDFMEDNFGILYTSPFNPATPLSNALISNDDGNLDLNFGFSATLVAGTSYTLVSTVLDDLIYGTFPVTITTPGSVPLSVTISSFNATNINGTGLLTWTTEKEINNVKFNVQKSIDGNNFSTIASVNTLAYQGNSNTKLNYSYTDNNLSAKNYYRLEQIDNNEKVTYSSIVNLKNLLNGISIKTLPNPIENNLTVFIESAETIKLSLNVFNSVGQIVFLKEMQLKAGKNSTKLNFENLPSGLYFLNAITDSGLSYKTTIQKK